MNVNELVALPDKEFTLLISEKSGKEVEEILMAIADKFGDEITGTRAEVIDPLDYSVMLEPYIGGEMSVAAMIATPEYIAKVFKKDPLSWKGINPPADYIGDWFQDDVFFEIQVRIRDLAGIFISSEENLVRRQEIVEAIANDSTSFLTLLIPFIDRNISNSENLYLLFNQIKECSPDVAEKIVSLSDMDNTSITGAFIMDLHEKVLEALKEEDSAEAEDVSGAFG